jgi:hypothetical protein
MAHCYCIRKERIIIVVLAQRLCFEQELIRDRTVTLSVLHGALSLSIDLTAIFSRCIRDCSSPLTTDVDGADVIEDTVKPRFLGADGVIKVLAVTNSEVWHA